MKLENLKKSELIELLTEIKREADFLEERAIELRKDYEETKSGVYLGFASGYEQASKFINEQISKYTESTRP